MWIIANSDIGGIKVEYAYCTDTYETALKVISDNNKHELLLVRDAVPGELHGFLFARKGVLVDKWYYFWIIDAHVIIETDFDQ